MALSSPPGAEAQADAAGWLHALECLSADPVPVQVSPHAEAALTTPHIAIASLTLTTSFAGGSLDTLPPQVAC